MKTKRGNEFDILGSSNVDGRLFFVCKLPEPLYYNGELIAVVVMPSTDFVFDNGLENAKFVTDDVDTEQREIPEAQ